MHLREEGRKVDEWKVRHYETAFSPEIQTDERHCQIGIINIQSQRGRSGQVGVVGGMGVGLQWGLRGYFVHD